MILQDSLLINNIPVLKIETKLKGKQFSKHGKRKLHSVNRNPLKSNIA